MKLRYLVLEACSPDELAKKVNEHLDQGWQLQGGVATWTLTERSDFDNALCFINFWNQAMTAPCRE